MSEAQKKAYEESADRWILPYGKPVKITSLFGDKERIVVEIGFGMGDATRQLAAMKPEWGILAVEVHKPGIGKLLWWMERGGLENIRIIEHDAVEVVSDMLPAGSIDGFHIWFPDPWPKKRHHKRRLIQPKFVDSMVCALKNGGYIHIATDWEDYAEHIIGVLKESTGLQNSFDRWAAKPDYRPDTKFENRGIKADRVIRDIIFKKEIP